MKKLTDCPYYLISRASLAVARHLKRALAAAELEPVRPSYLGVLMTLWRDDSLKGVDLGRQVGLEPSSMTGLLDRMERDGLIARAADPGDRRAQRICLTRHGRNLREPVLAVVDQALAGVLSGVAEGDVEHLKVTLRQVLTNLDSSGAP